MYKIIVLIVLILLLTISCSDTDDNVNIEIDNIESVEVIDGIDGNRQIIEDDETLDKIEELLSSATLNPLDKSDLTGYNKAIHVHASKEIVVYSSGVVEFDNNHFSSSGLYIEILVLLDLY